MERTGKPNRWVGLDLHKTYLVATGVNRDQEKQFGPTRVTLDELEAWAAKHLTQNDAVVVEMTTNTWAVYDLLAPSVHSVTVVHPPEVASIVKARVMTDKIAALQLAKLHAANVLPAVWVPDAGVRDLRAIVAQRRKHVNLVVKSKNRLHSCSTATASNRHQGWTYLPRTCATGGCCCLFLRPRRCASNQTSTHCSSPKSKSTSWKNTWPRPPCRTSACCCCSRCQASG